MSGPPFESSTADATRTEGDPRASGVTRRAQHVLRASALRWSRDRPVDVLPRLLRSVGLTLVAVLVMAPLAVAWGIGHGQVSDYLGPHQAVFSSSYAGEVELDLGPLGNAYLPSPVAPVGLQIAVGGVGPSTDGSSFFSPETLTAYTALFSDPDEAIAGITDRLVVDIVSRSVQAELVLMLVFAAWVARGHLIAPKLVPHTSTRHAVAVWATVTTVTLGSVLAPAVRTADPRVSVTLVAGTQFSGLTVDSLLLSNFLDRGIKGVRLLSERQEKAVEDYIAKAADNVLVQFAALPRPGTGETMMLGFSDLHCNQAMTELISRVAAITAPSIVLSSGDDTVNGTAAERGCITREARIADGVPFVVATGNHDSDVTEAQMRSNGMVVLDGVAVQAAGLTLVGDDDPERQVPFSHDRGLDRAETETLLGQRMVSLARGRTTDVILVHQPAASIEIRAVPDPPARLVLWGHFHSQAGPEIIMHADGSWTVGMQQGTAGGVKQPTITSFSTPFSPPLVSADVYFYFRDDATGLITGVQPLHFLPDASVVLDARMPTGDLATLSEETRLRLGATPTPAPETPADDSSSAAPR